MNYRDDSSEQVEYVYHWHRIIPAIIGLIMILVALYANLPGDSLDTATSTVAVVPAATETQPTATPAEEPAEPESAAGVAESGNPPPSDAPPSAEEAVSPVATPQAPEASEARAASSAPKTSAPTAEPIKQLQSDVPAPYAKLKPGQVKYSSKTIKNASLNQVLDQEPLNLNKGAIRLSEKKAVKVVFSGELSGGKQPVYYRWYHNGKLAAKVATQSSPEGKTAASKYVSYDVPGLWQVQVINSQGKVLAEAAFMAKR